MMTKLIGIDKPMVSQRPARNGGLDRYLTIRAQERYKNARQKRRPHLKLEEPELK